MAAEIKVGVGADVSDFQQGMKKAEGAVLTFEKSIVELEAQLKRSKEALKEATRADSVINIKKAIAATEERINAIKKLGDAASATNKSLDLKDGSRRASLALTDLGRVASDLPFGFMAIQNNITPLVESFGRFSSQSGSFKDTLKSLGAALTGPAGIALAFSATTAAITYLTQHPEKLQALLNSLTDTTKGLTLAQQAYNDSLADSVSKVQGEIANIHSLVNIAKDENLSKATRLQAIKELNKSYPELNNQIKLEGINSKETTALVNKLTDALVLRAKVQAVQSLIGDAFKKQLESQNSSLQAQASNYSKIKAIFQLALPVQGAFMANSTLMTSGAEEQADALKESQKSLSEYQKILDGLNTKLAETGNLFVKTPDKVKKAFEKINIVDLPKIESMGKDIADSIAKGLKSNEAKVGDTLANILSLNPALFARITQQLSDNLKEIPIGVKAPELGVGGLNDMLSGIMSGKSNVLDTSGMKVPGLDLSGLDKINSKVTNIKNGILANLKDFGTEASKIISTNLTSAFSGIGEAIGNALANGKDIVGAIGQTLLSSVGMVCKQLGEAAIAIGVGMLAIKASFKNPFTAIAAGVALVAVGAFISSSVANIPNGGGGSPRGASYSPSVPSGFSPSAPAGQAAHPSQNVFIPNTILKGTDIVISYNRTTALNGRTG